LIHKEENALIKEFLECTTPIPPTHIYHNQPTTNTFLVITEENDQIYSPVGLDAYYNVFPVRNLFLYPDLF
jgi:hypothetical protein